MCMQMLTDRLLDQRMYEPVVFGQMEMVMGSADWIKFSVHMVYLSLAFLHISVVGELCSENF